MARPRQVAALLVGAWLVLASATHAATPDAGVALHEARHGRSTTIHVDGDADLEVLLGPPSSPQVVVYMHGVCGDPLAFGSWARSARRRATFISLRGDEVCDERPSRRRWSWDLARIDRRIRQAVEIVSAFRVGVPLDETRIVLVGYSQGAHRVEQLAFRFPDHYRRVVMIAPANEPNAGRLAKTERVLLMAGEWDARSHIYSAFQALERRRHPSKYLELPKARHGQYGPDAARVMDEAFAWVLEEKAESSVGGVSKSAGDD